MDTVAGTIRRHGGVASWRELRDSLSRAEIEAALAEHRITRLRRNTYVLPDLAETRRLALAVGGTASHLSAAQHWGWKVKEPPARPCITMPRHARTPRGDFELHWQDLPPDDVAGHVTRRVPTVIACARTYDTDVALSVADSALREGAVTRADLLQAAHAAPRTGRRKAVEVVRLADRRAANPFESVLRWLALGVEGLSVTPQGRVAGVGRVDLLDARLGIVVEAESAQSHCSPRQLARDARRYTACARRGLVVVRFTWVEVMFHPDYVRQALADVVAARSRYAA